MRFKVVVDVMPKGEIADPQGLAIERALPTLGFSGIEAVRVGKHIRFFVEATNSMEADSIADEACRRFLSNPVIEDYEFKVGPAAGVGS